MNGKLLCAIGGVLLLSLAGVVRAEQTTSDADRIKALEAKVAELQGNTWLSERQSAEVKALVSDAIADAQSHPSLAGAGMTAGRDETAFFIGSEDGKFRLNFAGQIQLRYMANFRQGISNDDGFDDLGFSSWFYDPNEAGSRSINNGFEVTRAKLQFYGHIADPRLLYNIRLAVDPTWNGVSADTITIGYRCFDGKVTIWGGEDKAPFLRETLTQSYRQLAVERSLINYLFTVGAAQGIGLVWMPGTDLANDALKVQLMINDGFRSGQDDTLAPTQIYFDGIDDVDDDFWAFKGFNEGRADIAVTGRLDVKLAGAWMDMDDFAAWPDRPFSAFVGGAMHYEVGRTGDFGPNSNFFEWTLDGSAKYKGFGVFASVVGLHTMYEQQLSDDGQGDDSLYGAVLQGSYNFGASGIPLEPFIRYEVFVSESLRGKVENTSASDAFPRDTINLLTFGANWYNKKHDAKTTVDVVWAINELPPALAVLFDQGGRNTGLMPDASGHKNQMVIRVQYQLLF